MNVMAGKWPGVVDSYDGDGRSCRVSIPGLTDGSDVLPLAVFENPLGDRPGDTEIRILPGDLVWLEFECGDPRFPIITGYRTPRAGNPMGWRRWRHANIQLTAENTFLITVGATSITVTDGLVDIQGADLHVSGNTLISGNTQIVGNLEVNGQAMVHQNIMAALGISAGTQIIATGDISDQGGSKSMYSMRVAYNAHAGHYWPTHAGSDPKM